MTDDDTASETEHEPDAEPVAPAAPADEVAAVLVARIQGSVASTSHGQVVVHLPPSELANAAQILRDEEQFTMCVDVTAVDHLLDGTRVVPDGVVAQRFEMVANFLSHARNRRIRIICEVPEDEPVVPTLTELYPGTNFPEREVYDLLGIAFDGHPDLTRILMPDDWVGHPLGKDDSPARVPVTFKGDPNPR